MFWKEKKEELEVQKTRMGYCPFSNLCRDREISIATESADPVSRHGSQTKPTTRPGRPQPSLGVHDPAWARSTTQREGAIELSGSVSRQGSPCRNTVPRHTKWFGSRQRPSLSQ